MVRCHSLRGLSLADGSDSYDFNSSAFRRDGQSGVVRCLYGLFNTHCYNALPALPAGVLFCSAGQRGGVQPVGVNRDSVRPIQHHRVIIDLCKTLQRLVAQSTVKEDKSAR